MYMRFKNKELPNLFRVDVAPDDAAPVAMAMSISLKGMFCVRLITDAA